MKKLLFISLFAALLAAGCSKDEGPGDPGNNPPAEQEPGDDTPKIQDDEIWYTSSDGNIVEPNNKDEFGKGVEILSNTYEDGKGVIKFNAPVTEIGYYAFYECYNLTSITIPDSVTTIVDSPFKYCSGLTAFYGKFASEDNRCLIVDGKLISFAPAGLTEYTIPDGVTAIESHAFGSCTGLTSITIPDSVTTIGNFAFSSCTGLTSVYIPDSVTAVEGNPFAWCSGLAAFYGKFASEDNRCLIVDGKLISFAPAGLTEYTIPDGVTTIGDYAFRSCYGLTSVTIPDGVTEIGTEAFMECFGLTSITIPDGVTTIRRWAFFRCISLTSITIPDSVTEIGQYAFRDCTSLTNVYCKATTPPTLSDDVFKYFDNDYSKFILENLTAIYVPRASVEAYKAAENWSEYADLIEPYDF